MSYLFIVVIGAVVGYVAGQYLKGSELGTGPDVAAGAIGAGVAVLLARLVGPEAAGGFLLSAVLSMAGAVAMVYGMRRFTKETPVPVRTRPRRP